MAVPKKKTSSTRKHKRRTHWKAKAPALSTCPQCGDKKMPHRACPHCGYYKGKQVISAENE
ncbi:MAG TPA: 50S ribosomal protein L32 [bacterium]|nr:50S ribosomal protein L32 [bacterium]